MLAQQFVVFPWNNALTNALNNSLHILLFTSITVLLRWSLPNLSLAKLFACLFALAIATEVAQLVTGGSPSLADVARDLFGVALAFPMIFLMTRLRAFLAIALSVIATLAHPSLIFASYEAREARFPILYDGQFWDRKIISRSNSPIRITPDGFTHIVWAETTWPGLSLPEVVEDWSGYESIVAEVENSGDPQPLTIAVRHKGQRGTSAFVRNEMDSGTNVIRVPLDRLVKDSSGRQAPIVLVIIHTNRKYAGREIYLKQVYLE